MAIYNYNTINEEYYDDEYDDMLYEEYIDNIDCIDEEVEFHVNGIRRIRSNALDRQGERYASKWKKYNTLAHENPEKSERYAKKANAYKGKANKKFGKSAEVWFAEKKTQK